MRGTSPYLLSLKILKTYTDSKYMDKPLNIFDFTDYRTFVRTWLELAKESKRSNLTKLASEIRVHPTFLSQVLTSAKDLSLEQAALMSRHFAFTKLEQEFFFILVQISKAGSELLKEILLNKKKEIEIEKNKLSKRFNEHKQLNDEHRAIFYSSWLYLAIWAATSLGKEQTLTKITTLFSITPDKATEILSFLVHVGACSEKNGVYSPGEVHIHVSNESPFVVKHHTNWRMKAIQKMDTREQTELFFSGPMSVSKKDFNLIREKLNVAIKEVVTVVGESIPEEVVCLNIDFFKIN